MKTLYISDLDGTLLNQEGRLSQVTIKKLNELINNGINFTVATGRGQSAIEILKTINLKLPIIILNGSANYDFSIQKYIDIKTIQNQKAIKIVECIKEIGFKDCEIQILNNNELKRISIFNFNKILNCIMFTVLISEEKIEELTKKLNKIKGISLFINQNVYTKNEWFCDIVLKDISKGNSLLALKSKYRFDKVIAFGDSGNDLPLLEVADEFYAVENALDIVKENATGVIDSCFDDGVVEFISKQLSISC